MFLKLLICSQGIEVKLAQENLFHWQVTLCGPKDTSWEGGIFQLELIFDEEYNESPPEVYFLTVPFHPNIDIRSGRPCSDLLDQPDSWNPNIRIHTVLESLQNLLADPNLDDPVNVAAAEVFRKSPRLYEQLIRDCVVSSRRVYGT
ncbi:ubiquitin-conjugating enzyme/RWD-like protein [Cladochytrium replicatum]|nr:ubiquitin-conjugating enzyme/RWD-like protein [Cladochytrium replicatum]